MKTNVAVFFGGASVEHEISVISAVQAMHSMNAEKYNIIPIYITKQGEFYTGSKLKDINAFKDISSLLENSEKITISKTDNEVLIFNSKGGLFSRKPLGKIDIAFPIVHGTNCEDGSIQGYFEVLGIPYVGCDVLSSAVGMDKGIFKNVMTANNIPVLKCISFYAKEWVIGKEDIMDKIESDIGYPSIVKPSNLGSSVGIVKVKTADELPDAISLSMSFSNKILVEPAITSLREVNCSVLGDNDDCEASVCEEPVMSDEILSYTDKYMTSGKSKGMSSLKRKIPADLNPQKTNEIQNYAIETFKALGCCGVVRIDFLMDTADNDKVYVNEINTIPGSLSFYLWEPSGVKYTELLDRMIELGFKRGRIKSNLMFTYNTNILSMGGAFGTKGKK